MRELLMEVDQYNITGDECDDSDGSSDEEDDSEMKKVIQQLEKITQEEQAGVPREGVQSGKGKKKKI
jgi:hypothetical protein